jgi:hypothetical protein
VAFLKALTDESFVASIPEAAPLAKAP